MLESEILEKLQGSSLEERIRIIEAILHTLKNNSPHSESTSFPQRPAFGFMSGTCKILGDVVTPILPENTVNCD
jgi:hypothetical protein